MAGTTRRTHIVRCPLDDKAPEGDSIDIEVLDAIAFRGPNGDEMILNMPMDQVVPFIEDTTGGGHDKNPGNGATRRSHMKRITDGDNKLDIEVLEVVSFSDENGDVWILDMNATNGDPSVFNTTDNTGDSKSTRRTHNELVYNPFGKKGDQFLTIERCDAMAFRTINGQEMIIDCKSSDDQGSTDKRAATTVWSPKGYDPTKDDPKPPVNSDPHNYIKGVKGAASFVTGKEKISMGPLWWIRKINVGGGTILITFEYNVTQDSPKQPKEPAATLTNMPFNKTATFAITGLNGIYKQITDGGEKIAIVNPLSSAMGGLYQWSYPTYIEKKNTNGNSNILYVLGGEVDVTSENAFETYPGGTDECGARLTYGSLVSSFFHCNPQALGEAIGHGFTQTTLYYDRDSWDNVVDAQYAADALNSLEFIKESGITAFPVGLTLTPTAGTNTIIRRDVMGFNTGALKSKATLDSDKEFTFEIDVPACPDGSVTIKGSAFTSKTKDFPLDSKNVPQTAGWPQDTFTKNFPSAGKVTVHVNTEDDKDHPFVYFTSTGFDEISAG